MSAPITLAIPDMSCGHCRQSITTALTALDAGAVLNFDQDARRLTLTSQVSIEAVLAALDDIGFEAGILG